MTWLFFMDESGHDHKNTPMEVRGGVAIHAQNIFKFSQDIEEAIQESFGINVRDYKESFEIKGSKLLANRTWQQANYRFEFSDKERHKQVKEFLNCNRHKKAPTQAGFCAYAKSRLLVADKIFDTLKKYDAQIFASIIPRGTKPPKEFSNSDYLRKDQVFLFERYFNFLEHKAEHGLIIMDETEKQNDRRFIQRMQNYFTKTQAGRERAHWIVPTPFFVSSDMVAGIQAADVVIYAINWGFRLPQWRFKGASDRNIFNRYGGIISDLQFKGDTYNRHTSQVYDSYGIVYVPDPYTARQ